MNKKEELLIIALAIILLISISIIIKPSITGLAIYEFSNFTDNENIITTGGIQLKQQSYTETWTEENKEYYSLVFAEKSGYDRLSKLQSLDGIVMDLEKNYILKIKFNGNLENNDLINLYLKIDTPVTVNICNFNAVSCNNETLYASINYPGQPANYPALLNLPVQTNEFTIDSVEGMIKIDYINASHTEVTEHTNTTYYYNSAEIETEIIQPENLLKWDMFTTDYTLNNQIVKFYYSFAEDYTEFISPYNFSIINSSKIKFKLALFSDNTSTPVINNLTITYYTKEIQPCIENWTCDIWNTCNNSIQTRICTDSNNCGTILNKPVETQNCTVEVNNPGQTSTSSSSGVSATRFKSPAPTAVSPTTPEVHKITQQVEPLKETNTETIIPTGEIVKETYYKTYINLFLFILLISLCYIYYKRIKKS